MKQITISLQKAKTQTINEFKSKAQKVQKELKDILRLKTKGALKEKLLYDVDKIFAENFGGLIK